MDATGPIAVTGATGQQGGAVVRHLLARGFRVRALSRDPGAPQARALASRGAEVLRAELDDSEGLKRVFTGAHGVFSVQNFWTAGIAAEVRWGRNVADAAHAAGVAHLVYSSVGGAERATGIPHFDSKWAIEQHVAALGIPATVLRPVTFMDNFTMPRLRRGIARGTLTFPMHPQRRLQMIAVDDIGAFAALAFAAPERYLGRALELAGDELTMTEAVAVLTQVLGRPVRYRRLPLWLARPMMGKEMTAMFRWFHHSGFQADIAALRVAHPGLQRFADWAATVDWRA